MAFVLRNPGFGNEGEIPSDGPCAPEVRGAHRYRFRLPAPKADAPLTVPKEPVADLWEAVQPDVIAVAPMVGIHASRGSGARRAGPGGRPGGIEGGSHVHVNA